MTQSGNDDSRAVLREVNGCLVLDDPVALAVIRAVEKANCQITYQQNADRIAHFKQRAIERRLDPQAVVIVILNVDDSHGGLLAEKLMPGFNWQQFRDQGQVPFARGLAEKSGVTKFVAQFDPDVAARLQENSSYCVLVIDHGVAEAFLA